MELTGLNDVLKVANFTYTVGKGDAGPLLLSFNVSASDRNDVSVPTTDFHSSVSFTANRSPSVESVLSCEETQLKENGTMQCTVHPKNAFGSLVVASVADFVYEIYEEYPGGLQVGTSWVYRPSLSNFTSQLSNFEISHDGSQLTFTFLASPSVRKVFLRVGHTSLYYTPVVGLDGKNITGSPWIVYTKSPCFDFPNEQGGMKFSDAPGCIADARCYWCSSEGSFTGGKCVHYGDLESELQCDGSRFHYSVEVSGFSVDADLSLWPNRLGQFYLTLPHNHLRVQITLIAERNNKFRIVTRWGQRPEIEMFENDVYRFSADATVHEAPSPPVFLTLEQEDIRCNETLLASGVCNLLYIAVVGDNRPPSNWGASEYSLQVFREPTFSDMNCTEHGGYTFFQNCEWTPLGSAQFMLSNDSTPVARLVHSRRNEIGALYYYQKVINYLGFEVTVRFRIHNKTACYALDGFCAGGDGFAIVLQAQDSSSPPASMSMDPGSTIGFSCFDPLVCVGGLSPAFAVEFDTFYNKDKDDPRVGDPHVWINGTRYSNNEALHVALFAGEGIVNNAHFVSSTLHKGSSVAVPNFADGRIHTAKLEYFNSLLLVFIDDFEMPVLSVSYAFETIRDPSGRAFVGVTASTGDAAQTVDIYSFEYCSTLGCVAA
eukprot:ANDGO_02888.mRNA.1 hypothetical protein PPTG_00079